MGPVKFTLNSRLPQNRAVELSHADDCTKEWMNDLKSKVLYYPTLHILSRERNAIICNLIQWAF